MIFTYDGIVIARCVAKIWPASLGVSWTKKAENLAVDKRSGTDNVPTYKRNGTNNIPVDKRSGTDNVKSKLKKFLDVFGKVTVMWAKRKVEYMLFSFGI